MRAHHLRPLVGLLRRPGGEEAAQPFLSRLEHPVLRHRRLQPGLQVLPELGHLEVARDGPPAGRGLAGGDRRGGAEARLQVGRLHLQRPGDLRRVRDGHRRRLPRARRADGGGDRGLHARRAAARVLREDGRGQRRPEGASPTTSTASICGGRLQPVLDTLVYLVQETQRLDRDHDAADPGQERFGRGDRGRVQVDQAEPGRRRAAALHRFPSRLEDDRHRRARRRRR